MFPVRLALMSLCFDFLQERIGPMANQFNPVSMVSLHNPLRGTMSTTTTLTDLQVNPLHAIIQYTCI
jgi:hypothetical protein